jgi:acetylornithine deacetylase/succinyl-diaminopimelate desuccinylase-like protein
VLDAMESFPGFLESQPSLVLRLGPRRPRASTLMFNVHLDTVAGHEPVSFDGRRFRGRGAIDAKGPAVALLAGIRAAREIEPAVGTSTSVLVQAVSGEEGGALGVFGTRPLVEQGYVGCLNVFCEPTGLRVLRRSTAAMTACVEVSGHDAVDDEPARGHNATVLLGYLAQHLAAELPSQASDGQVCVAGLRTGSMHNKVYGSGRLLMNLSYGSPDSAERLERAVIRAYADGLARFRERFGSIPPFEKTAAEAAEVARLGWLKRGLPALCESREESRPAMSAFLFDRVGLSPWPDHLPAFTCDAIWMQGVPCAATVIYGPGGLGANNAHGQGEFADLVELEAFAQGVARLLVCFARERPEQGET